MRIQIRKRGVFQLNFKNRCAFQKYISEKPEREVEFQARGPVGRFNIPIRRRRGCHACVVIHYFAFHSHDEGSLASWGRPPGSSTYRRVPLNYHYSPAKRMVYIARLAKFTQLVGILNG